MGIPLSREHDEFPDDDLGPAPGPRPEPPPEASPAPSEPRASFGEDDLPWAPPPAWARGRQGGPGSAPRAPEAAAPAPAPDAAGEAADSNERYWLPAHLTESIDPELAAKSAGTPIWQRGLDLLTRDRRAQLVAGLVVLAGILIYSFWPRSTPGVALSSLIHNPRLYEGRSVRVRGRVAETFPMGSGWAFTLVQGHDTITVFTRFRTPIRGERLELMGSPQSGALDGVTRVALFEEAPAPK